jgi:Ca2+-binding RTX toxin-like protein
MRKSLVARSHARRVAGVVVVGFTVVVSPAVAAEIDGTDNDDLLSGTAAADVIDGLAGDDLIHGCAGGDDL